MTSAAFHFTRARLQRDGKTGAIASLLAKSSHDDAGHALIWTLFPPDTQTRPFLYREIESGSYFILSTRPPSDETGLWVLETKPYAPELDPGDRLGFSLVANATISRPSPGETGDAPHARGQRVGLLTRARERGEPADDTAYAWLATRLARAGAQLDTDACTVDFDPKRVIRTSEGSKIIFNPARFEGLLTVEAPERFLTALCAGFGRSRAYGLGLMLIRRAG